MVIYIEDEVAGARAKLQRVEGEYRKARDQWESRPSATKQDHMHRLKREWETARDTLAHLEQDLARDVWMKQAEQTRERQPEHERAKVRRAPDRGRER